MKKIFITTIKELVAVIDYSDFETICSDGKFRRAEDVIEMVKHHLPSYDKYEAKVLEKKVYFYKFNDIIVVKNEKDQ